MSVIRPVRTEDLPSLMALSRRAGFGLTTLPPDEDVLKRRIADSLRGFARMAEKPGGETYLLVLEGENGEVIGTAGMVSKVGGFEPFYTFKLETEVHASSSLHKRHEIPTLHLVKDHNGPSEIGSLFLSPDHRRGYLGRLLSLSRFLFMADHPGFFDHTVLAEMRGRIDAQGHSPFWEAIGRHFFQMEFPHADYLVMQDKRFLAELMPRHPIYVPLLPPDAQAVINQVHPDSAPALALLESEGFGRNGMVDIFEGGPVVACARDRIRTIRESKVLKALQVERGRAEERQSNKQTQNHNQGLEAHLISNTLTHGFRALVDTPQTLDENHVGLSTETLQRLCIEPGDQVRLVTLRGPDQAHKQKGDHARSTEARGC